jgi:hypothetical protein
MFLNNLYCVSLLKFVPFLCVEQSFLVLSRIFYDIQGSTQARGKIA